MLTFKHTLLAATTSILLAATPAVQAAPVSFHVDGASFTPGAGYGVDDNEFLGDLLDVGFSTAGFAAQSFLLNPGESHSFQFGTVNFREPNAWLGINMFEMDGLELTATLSFTDPLGAIANVVATATAHFGKVNDSLVDFTLDWDSFTVDFGNGGSFDVSLGDLSFTEAGVKSQSATITLRNAPAAAVPEPGTLALAGLALAGLGLARRRPRG